MLERSHHDLAVLAPGEAHAIPLEDQASGPLGDDVLRLVFVACHPVLSMDAQVALCLRLVCGLDTEAIARAFLVPVPTIAQRLVRARRTLEEACVELEVPRGDALAARTAAVLRVVYLVFNEGYAPTDGDSLVRTDLCDQALHLGRLLVGLMPEEPEPHGLLALMELQASRTAARIDARGQAVLLLDQDRTLWDQAAITRGLHSLIRAHLLGGRGPYVLSAEIGACHARARRAEDTDWPRIVARYDELIALTPSPVVALNRALAVAMAEGPAAGLARLDALTNERALARYHRLPAARADLLEKLGRRAEAREAYVRAAELATHPRERSVLMEAAVRCGG
jgi:predicted RNA polymerase sigma factor